MDYLNKSLCEIKKELENGTISSEELTKMCFEQIKATKNLNALVSTCEEFALKQAQKVDQKRKNGEKLGLLAGVPIVIKDNINLEGTKTTCASKFLENFVSPYTATCAQKLLDADAVIIGKANMDEFAMGSSNENSAFGPVLNPVNQNYVPGGSSGGSATSVKACQCFASLGTDTGGSIREPASFCGVVGLKPTYGRVSRFGVVAFASSLDQVGVFSRTVKDNALMLEVIAGEDQANDMTSNPEPVPHFSENLRQDIKGMKIGVAKQFFDDKLNAEVKQSLESALKFFEQNGATLVNIDLPCLDVASSVYYILSSAEAASNLARFDGVKYGFQAPNFDGIVDLYFESRTQGFGPEVKRRIMLGNYVLSSGYFDAYYRKAKRVQKIIQQEFANAFEKCDVMISPTVATTAFKLGEKTSDPVAMYLSDIFTVPINLAKLPAMSIPCGSDSKGLPIGMQIIAKQWNEQAIFDVANFFEQNTKEAK